MSTHLSPTTIAQDIAVAGFNVGVWFATIISWANVNQLMTFLATGAAVSVSIASFLWIRKQARDSGAKQKLEVENLKIERAILEKRLAGTHFKPKPLAPGPDLGGFGE